MTGSRGDLNSPSRPPKVIAGESAAKKMKKVAAIHWTLRASLRSLRYNGYLLFTSLTRPPNRQPVLFNGSMNFASLFSGFSPTEGTQL